MPENSYPPTWNLTWVYIQRYSTYYCVRFICENDISCTELCLWGLGFPQRIRYRKGAPFLYETLLGVTRSTQNAFVYGEFGTKPMKVLRKIQIWNTGWKLSTVKKSLYVSNSYWVMYTDVMNLPSKPNWATQVRDMLSHLGFREAWYTQDVCDTEPFVYSFRQRVYDNNQQDWCGSLNDSSRAITYRAIRSGLETRLYLSKVFCVSHPRALARLITSSYRLWVETGRWERPLTPYPERKCVFVTKMTSKTNIILPWFAHWITTSDEI